MAGWLPQCQNNHTLFPIRECTCFFPFELQEHECPATLWWRLRVPGHSVPLPQPQLELSCIPPLCLVVLKACFPDVPLWVSPNLAIVHCPIMLVRRVTQKLISQGGRRESTQSAFLPPLVSAPSSCNALFLITVGDYCANHSFLFQAQFLISGSIWLHVRRLYILVIENLNQTGLRKKEMHHLGCFVSQSQNAW